MNLAPAPVKTPIWGVRLLICMGAGGIETYTLDVTKWKVFCWLVWRSLRNHFTRLFNQ